MKLFFERGIVNNIKFNFKDLPLKNSRKNHNDYQNYNNHPDRAEYLLDNGYGLYVQAYFREVLSLERKRAERSRKRFLLVLINIHNLLRNNGEGKILKNIARALPSLTRETDIAGWYDYGSVMGIIFTEINGVNEDIIGEKIYNNLSNILDSEQLKKIEISSHVFPEEYDKSNPYKTETDLHLYPDLSNQKSSKRISLFLKRSIDIIGSIFGILIFSPLFLIVPILIKLSSQGHVLFKQERLGQFGNKFTFFKFRTMHISCDERIHKKYIKDLICNQKSVEEVEKNGDKGCTYKLKNDPRITLIGKFLRKSSLDELPQFFNVLKGDMSLVGPRPPIPYELEHYDVWHRRRIFEMKPGITGIWQVNGRSSTTFDEMVRMDIQYSRKWSLLLDIKILLKTPYVVVFGKGGY
ncbi:UDP-glucose:undecaprenyl-phosphate glucose-1-phosphate transferase [bacterium BMS3Abin10]|nr:UDP-glucose:undecaprenyl-phosphate glucose-1-phosphate transferase [bacterium BMS3Abin10]